MPEVTAKTKVIRFCVHCYHEWVAYVTAEELRKIVEGDPIGECVNPSCGLRT